ncbi:hypothetical protein [Leptospira levettii]|uniref:hypothetical protein n=1 Tax=Leptospira levettii TaxID=2023178 RepID=UPI0024343020|nr:hypothetical protein [Leptospira levettii]
MGGYSAINNFLGNGTSDIKGGKYENRSDAFHDGYEQKYGDNYNLGQAATLFFGFGKQNSKSNPNKNIGKVHGNSKLSTKVQHGYEIVNVKTGEILEYGISGQTLRKDGSSSPRIDQKIRTKYNNDPNVKGNVLEKEIPGRQKALEWEINKVSEYINTYGQKPVKQIKP